MCSPSLSHVLTQWGTRVQGEVTGDADVFPDDIVFVRCYWARHIQGPRGIWGLELLECSQYHPIHASSHEPCAHPSEPCAHSPEPCAHRGSGRETRSRGDLRCALERMVLTNIRRHHRALREPPPHPPTDFPVGEADEGLLTPGLWTPRTSNFHALEPCAHLP